MVVILLVLPAGLMLLDGLICRTTYHWLNAPATLQRSECYEKKLGIFCAALALRRLP